MLSHSMLRRTNLLSAVSTEVFEYISEMVSQHLELLMVLEQSRRLIIGTDVSIRST